MTAMTGRRRRLKWVLARKKTGRATEDCREVQGKLERKRWREKRKIYGLQLMPNVQQRIWGIEIKKTNESSGGGTRGDGGVCGSYRQLWTVKVKSRTGLPRLST